jgi:maltooligosyltrehalose trehalohydrolase
MEIEVSGRRHEMRAGARGMWTADVDAADADYAFRIDGGDPRPDPRSPWQPHGVHGPSRRVDHSAFRWSDDRWSSPPLETAVIYEMHVGTFTPESTFDGAIRCLDHLVDLGITHLEIMPVNDFPGARGWGYDGVALFAPKNEYGGPEGLKRLVDACHAKGLAALLDVVYNHLGPAGNYLGEFGPYFTDKYGTPWGQAVNLDRAGSDEVRRFICDNAIGWLRDYHFDGLRLDAVHAYFDHSATHLLEQLADEVGRLGESRGRRYVLIAESDLNDPRVVRPVSQGGYGIDCQWSDDFHHALHSAVTGETNGYYAGFGSLGLVAKALTAGFVFDGQYAPARDRVHGRPLGDVPGHRLLAYVQTHDQVGNRAKGERWSHLAPEGAWYAAAALMLTSPFVPMIFQGEEWAAGAPFQYFTDHDKELGGLITEGRRKEFADFGWSPDEIPDPQDPATFERSRLPWDEREKEPHRAVLDWYRRLIRLRRAIPALTDGDRGRVSVAHDDTARWLRMDRGPITVACNLGGGRTTVPLSEKGREVMLASGAYELSRSGLALDPGAVVLGGGEAVSLWARSAAAR